MENEPDYRLLHDGLVFVIKVLWSVIVVASFIIICTYIIECGR